jgi:hypothetical protein
MASSDSTMTDTVIVRQVRTKYHWPAMQLNFWLLIMLVGSATILGVFSSFITVQQQLQVGIPWFVFVLLIVSSHLLIYIVQVLSLLDHRLRTRNPLHPRHVIPDIPPAATTRHSGNGLLYFIRAMDGRTDRHLH